MIPQGAIQSLLLSKSENQPIKKRKKFYFKLKTRYTLVTRSVPNNTTMNEKG